MTTAHSDEQRLEEYHKSRTEREGGQLVAATVAPTSNPKVLSGRKELKITVWYEFPPIPDRTHDYGASYDHHDGDSGNIGWGSTPYMAILDLINNVNPTDEWGNV